MCYTTYGRSGPHRSPSPTILSTRSSDPRSSRPQSQTVASTEETCVTSHNTRAVKEPRTKATSCSGRAGVMGWSKLCWESGANRPNEGRQSRVHSSRRRRLVSGDPVGRSKGDRNTHVLCVPTGASQKDFESCRTSMSCFKHSIAGRPLEKSKSNSVEHRLNFGVSNKNSSTEARFTNPGYPISTPSMKDVNHDSSHTSTAGRQLSPNQRESERESEKKLAEPLHYRKRLCKTTSTSQHLRCMGRGTRLK